MLTDLVHRVELLFVFLFAYVRRIRAEKLDQLAAAAADKAKQATPAMMK